LRPTRVQPTLGTPPIARATGVSPIPSTTAATGFLFRGFEETAFFEPCSAALGLYRAGRRRALQRAAMARDFSWGSARSSLRRSLPAAATPQPA